MSAFAGPAPWFQGVSETYKNGRRKNRLTSGDQEWNLTEGWHAKRSTGWYNHPGKNKIVKKVKVTAPDGKQVELYKSEGYDDAIGFHNNGSDEEAAAYAYNALDPSNVAHGPISSVTVDQGHIKKIEYAAREQVLRVTFANGSICIFFRVPTAIGGILVHAAESNWVHHTDKRGVQRHLLGKIFWDYVRIRHQRYGARYPFQYEKQGALKITGSGRRYKIKLTDENFEDILGRNYEGPLKPGMTISAVMSEDEFKMFTKARTENRENSDLATVTDNGAGSYDYDPETQFFKGLEQKESNVRSSISNAILTDAEREEFKALRHDLKKGWKQNKSNKAEAALADKDKKANWKNLNPEEYADLEYRLAHGELTQGQVTQIINNATGFNADAYRKKPRPGYVKYVNGSAFEERYGSIESILGEEKAARYNELLKRATKPGFARPLNRRMWSKADLIAMSDMHRQGHIAFWQKPYYDEFIRNEDWHGAFEWLKTHSGDVYGYNRELNKDIKLSENRAYASPLDQLDL